MARPGKRGRRAGEGFISCQGPLPAVSLAVVQNSGALRPKRFLLGERSMLGRTRADSAPFALMHAGIDAGPKLAKMARTGWLMRWGHRSGQVDLLAKAMAGRISRAPDPAPGRGRGASDLDAVRLSFGR
jgi:hypothetical protein